MTITSTHIIIAAALAFVTVAAIALSAGSLQAARDRLEKVFYSLGLIIVVVCGLGGAGMLGWGFASKNSEFIYLSLIPLVAAGATSNLMTRRRRMEQSTSFWRDTFSLWRDRSRESPDPAHARSRTVHRSGEEAAEPARSFSFSFNLGGRSADLLGSLAQMGAHHLSGDRVSVFPNMIQLQIQRAAGATLSALDRYRSELTIRRDDGGPLSLQVRTDLDFLRLALDPPADDGTYALSISLDPARLPVGPFAGTISIETGEQDQPLVTVPVTGEVR